MDDTTAIGTLKRALAAERLPYRDCEPLDRHTTFRIGGPAAVFCEPETTQELVRTLELCQEYGVRHYLLGNGSNTLFSDRGFAGAVIATGRLQNRKPVCRGNALWAGAGVNLSSVCTAARQRALSGLEFAFGIPGTVGGAVYMNAGAYGGEMKGVLASVTFLDDALRLRTLPVEKLAMGYRTSLFETTHWCILEAEFRLKPGQEVEIERKMQEYLACRKAKQPLDIPSAGSTFKRPEGAFAGQLIEECGLRGLTVGGAQISTKHCGFVVNIGGATCADVVALTEQAKKIVLKETGYTLEREIRIVK